MVGWVAHSVLNNHKMDIIWCNWQSNVIWTNFSERVCKASVIYMWKGFGKQEKQVIRKCQMTQRLVLLHLNQFGGSAAKVAVSHPCGFLICRQSDTSLVLRINLEKLQGCSWVQWLSRGCFQSQGWTECNNILAYPLPRSLWWGDSVQLVTPALCHLRIPLCQENT